MHLPPQLKIKISRLQSDLRRKLHETIRKVTDDMGRRHTFNTAIAANMELVNELQSFNDSSANGQAVIRESLDAIILMLAPILPHVCHAMWQRLGHQSVVHEARWPALDQSALIKNNIDLVVQVNGKKRATINLSAEAENSVIEATAMQDKNVKKFIEDQKIVKIIVVPGRLVNIVVK